MWRQLTDVVVRGLLLVFAVASCSSQFVDAAKPGTIISAKEVDLSHFLGVAVDTISGYIIKYHTLDSRNKPIVGTTTVAIPLIAHEPHNLVTVQYPYDSVCVACEPSRFLQKPVSTNITDFGTSHQIAALIDQGWFTAIPDHEGPNAAFQDGIQGAHVVLDSLRAILKSHKYTGINPNARVGLWGYSGAGGITEWSAELAHDYAPDLDIKVASIGGIAPNPFVHLKQVNKHAAAGFFVITMDGLARSNPKFARWLKGALKPSAHEAFIEKPKHYCTQDINNHYGGKNVFKYFKKGEKFSEDPEFIEGIQRAQPNGTYGYPRFPTFYYEAVHDTLTKAINQVDALMDKYCKKPDIKIQYQRNNECKHVSEAIQKSAQAVQWLQKGLDGQLDNFKGCHKSTVSEDTIPAYGIELLNPKNYAVLSALLVAALEVGD